MKNKMIVCVSLFLLTSMKLSAQETTDADFTSGISKLMSWIVNFDDVINSITEKEKLRKLHRLLGDVNLDVSNIYDEKILLAINISKKENLTDQTVIQEVRNQITEIEKDIEELLDNLRKMKGLINQTNQSQIDAIITEIESGYKYKKLVYLKDIRDYLFKKNISYTKILEEANLARDIAADSKQKITVAREKIFALLTK